MTALAKRVSLVFGAVFLVAASLGSCRPAGAQNDLPCLAIRPGEPIYDIEWLGGAQRLVVVSVVGPFDTSAGTVHFTEVSWPSRNVRLLESLPDANGAHVGADGTLYWMLEDGIWSATPGGDAPRRRAKISSPETSVDSWVITGDTVLVMRSDLQHEIDAYTGGDEAPTVWSPPNVNAYHLWASLDGATVVVTTKTDFNADAQLEVHDASGNVHSVTTGLGLPIVRWMSASGGRIAFQQFNGALFMAAVDGSGSPMPISAIPSGADAVSGPSSEGVVAYSGGGSGRSNVCFANNLPDDALR